MKEIKTGIEQGGKQIISFAPSAEASRGVLQSEGFENADTVARLLVDEKLQKQVNGQVLWIDESGLLGNKQMNGVMQIAKEQNARLILTGDTRQHNSVERGDAMRILLEKSGVAPIRVNEIQRQRNAPTYKQAVKYISEQKLEKGFDALERMGAIREIEGAEVRHSTIAKDYVQATQKGQSVLVVAPTHREGEQVTNSIRKELKASGKLDKKDRMFTTQKNAGFTEAQKKDPALYHEGLALQFHQNAKGIKRGQIFDVVGGDAKGGILIQDINDMNAKPRQLPFEQASKFSVFEKRQLPLSKGDQIRITQNGFSRDNHRLNNGNMAQVTGFDKNGNIQVSTGKRSFTLDKEHRNFTSGYCATSHASQGKTVDRVLIAQSSASAAAASKEQFYVSVSRGRKGVTVYTDNKQELKDSVGKSGQRKTAMEVAMQADKNKTPLQNQQKHVSRLATFARVKYERMRAIVGKMMFGKK
jgi:ATP-dependent exoDNAse (exonuclease V) alpha subunit